jgi:aspartyl-tRNA(Asn)/glutamyl-tRNA(Gln) amidotransferase subunit A
MDLSTLTITRAHDMLVKKEITAVDLARAYLKAIEEKNADINAYIEVYDDVIAQAEAAQKKIDEGTATMLTGIPLAIKDNILIQGKVATSGSHILDGYTATYDAFVIKKLKEHGAVFLGRANMDEFAMGSSTETSYYGPTRNPYDRDRVPGGSSGGPAAAVAMDGALASLGSDTGGSIRQPAALCGLVGLKPSYGAVSRSGLMALASSLDQIGPFTKSVEDSKIIFEAITGKDPLDSTSVAYTAVKAKSGPMILGVPYDFLKQGLDLDVLANFEESIEKLKKSGHIIKDVSLPNIGHSLPTYYIIQPAEASSNLARFDGVKYGLHKDGKNLLEDYMLTRGEGFGKEVRRRIILGTYVLSAGYYDAYYNKAIALREIITNDFQKAFKDVDAILTPTSPCPAFKIGEKTANPLSMYLSDIFTVSVNITGLPGISVPSGTAEREGKQLPLGLQIIAPLWGEDILFTLAAHFEKVR